MTENKWKNWNIEDEKISGPKNNQVFIFGRRLKALIIFFTLFLIGIINLNLIEVLSLAEGKVIPQSRIKYIQHLEGGIVEEILIEEGEKVVANQPLIVLSNTKASSDYEEISARLDSIEISILRILAEKKSLESIPDNEDFKKFDPDLIKFENELLLSRRKSIESEKKTIQKNIINLEKRYKLTKEQTKISEKLLKVEATNKFKHLELLRELSNIEGLLDEKKNKLNTLLFTYNEQLNNELSEYRREKSELQKRIKKFSDSLQRTTLTSPVIGTIKLIAVNSKGEIVAPGITVVEIVPEDEKLIIEAKLPLSEIGYVSVGLDTKIRLNSPEGSRFKAIEGKVVFVSADRTSTDNSESFYLVKVETNEVAFSKGSEIYRLYSGVPVIVGVITGKRSFLDYFLSPFRNNIAFSLSER